MLLGVLLVIATLRGDVPQAEGGEDVDLRHPADWTTVLKLVGVLLFTVADDHVPRLGRERCAAVRRIGVVPREPHARA